MLTLQQISKPTVKKTSTYVKFKKSYPNNYIQPSLQKIDLRSKTSYVGIHNNKQHLFQQLKCTLQSERQQDKIKSMVYQQNQNDQTYKKRSKSQTKKIIMQRTNRTKNIFQKQLDYTYGQYSKIIKLNQVYKFPHYFEESLQLTNNKKQNSNIKGKSLIEGLNNKNYLIGFQIKKYDLSQKLGNATNINKISKSFIFSPKTKSKQLKKKRIIQNYNLKSKSTTLKRILGHKDLFQEKAKKYRQFIFKIYFTNSIYKQMSLISQKYDKTKQIKYIAYVGQGNNSNLIKNLLRKRWWWTVICDITKQTNFIWTQLKNIDFIRSQKMFEKYRIEQKCAEKAKKLENQSQDCRLERLLMHKNDFILYKNYLKQFNKQQLIQFSKRFSIIKKSPIRILTQNQRVHNHFQFNQFIGNKKALLNNIITYYTFKRVPLQNYNIPRTFHIQHIKDIQMIQFLNLYKQKQILNSNHKNSHKLYYKNHYNNNSQQIYNNNIWILKPGQNSNRGQGIRVCKNLVQIMKILNNRSHTHIIQQYICDLLLYHNRKFDIRTYVLITQVNGILKAYWYQDGYIRTSSQLYNLNDLSDTLVHLTNDAIQKYGPNYGRFEPGNKISYQQLQKYLDYQYQNQQQNQSKNGKNILKNRFDINILKNEMKKIATDAVFASYPRIDPNSRSNNFQIFGLDFIVDKNFRPWLLQINTNPCLELSSPLLARIIPRMVQNAFKIGLDPLFPPTACPYASKPYLTENFVQNNKFQLIFDSQYDRNINYQNIFANKHEKYEQEQDIYSNEGCESEKQIQ